MLAVARALCGHALNVCTKIAAFQRETVQRCAPSFGEIEKTFGTCIAQAQNGATAERIVPARSSSDRYAWMDMQFAREISARRDENRSGLFSCGVEGLLKCSGIVGLSVARGTEAANIEDFG